MLPEGWAAARVDDLGNYLNGLAFKPSDWGSDGIGIIRIQNLTDPDKPLNRTTRSHDSRYRVARGDILVSWSATLDAFLWDREDALLNQHIFKVTPSPGVNKDFLFHQLRLLIRELSGSEHLHGSTMKHINRGPFLAHAAVLAPLPEQRRIVAKLEALTARLSSVRRELERASSLAAGLRTAASAAAFDGALTAHWRQDAGSSGAAATDRQLDEGYQRQRGSPRRKAPAGIEWSPTIAIPSTWRWVSVDQLVSEVQYGSSSKTHEDASGVPVLRMGNIQNGEIDWSSLKYLPAEHPEFPDLLLHDQDVLFNRTNSFELVGKSALFRGSGRDASFASYLIRVRAFGILPELLVRYLNSRYGRTWIQSVASQQVGQANVNGSKLRSLGVPLPPPDEQVEILRILGATFAHADRLEAEASRALALLDRLESAILAKAFRGELVPQDPSDEPASVLLERIRAERAAAPAPKRGRRWKAAASAEA